MDDREKGWGMVTKLVGEEAVQAQKGAFEQWGIDRIMVEDFMANIISRPQLDLRTRELCTLSAFLASNVVSRGLAFHFGASLNVAGVDEIKELILQNLYVCGLPLTLRNFEIFDEVLEQREEESLKTAEGEKKQEAPAVEDALGKEKWKRILSDLNAFDPTVADYMEKRVFGKFFSTFKALDLRTRFLCLTATLLVLDNMRQLKLVISTAIRVGCSPQEVKEVIVQMGAYHGWPAVLNGVRVFHEAVRE